MSWDGTREVMGDRVIYRWGKHIILGGLELDLETMFWSFAKEGILKKVKKIEFTSGGDDISERYLKLISEHLVKKIWLPTKEEINTPEIYREWKDGYIKISVYLFEMHAYRLHFKIEREY
jgi:hypothetical protein